MAKKITIPILAALLTLLFVGCEQKESEECVKYCAYDLASGQEWHGIEAKNEWQEFNVFHLRACDDSYDDALKMETESGAIIRTRFCPTCNDKTKGYPQ